MLACSTLSARAKRFGEVPVNEHSTVDCRVVQIFTVMRFIGAKDQNVPGTNVSMEDASIIMGNLMGYNVNQDRFC